MRNLVRRYVTQEQRKAESQGKIISHLDFN